MFNHVVTGDVPLPPAYLQSYIILLQARLMTIRYARGLEGITSTRACKLPLSASFAAE